MSQPTPSVSPELKVLMRRLKLGQLLATLPERLALARSHELTHIEFLEQLFSDEVQRRGHCGDQHERDEGLSFASRGRPEHRRSAGRAGGAGGLATNRSGC